MLKGMKAKRQLAAFVALTVGGAFAGAPVAYICFSRWKHSDRPWRPCYVVTFVKSKNEKI